MNMKKKWEKIKSQIFKVIITINSHHTGAYAHRRLIFCAVFDPHIFASLDDGSLYADNDERSYDSGFKVFPESVAAMIRSIVSQVYFQSGTIVPGYDCCSALVSGERRSVCHIGIKQHL